MTINNKHTAEQLVDGSWSLNQIYFYLTAGCNLACRHCWLAPGFDEDGTAYPTLPVDLFESSIHEAKPLGLSGVKLTGGEPLLHPQITKILEIVRREGLRLTIETNGVLCTPAMAKEIAKTPNSFISVSIDGADAVTHEWIRGVPGCFEKACQGVRNLAAVKTPPQVIMTVMRSNANQVEAVVRTAEKLGAASVKFNVVQPTARGQQLHETDEALGIAEIITLGRDVEMELAQTTKLQLFFDYPHAFRPLSRMARGDGCDICGILGILGVIPSGYYALCGIGEHISELVFGEVGEDSLEAVWMESPVLQELREGLPSKLEGVCACCLMRHLCLGSCIAQNYYNSGSLWSPFWFCQQAEKAGFFPESRLMKVMSKGNAQVNVR